jgi:hypothetical protein
LLPAQIRWSIPSLREEATGWRVSTT